MDKSTFNHLVNIIMRSLIAICLILGSPELRREYFGKYLEKEIFTDVINPSKTQTERKKSIINNRTEHKPLSESPKIFTIQNDGNGHDQDPKDNPMHNSPKVSANVLQSTSHGTDHKTSSMNEEIELKVLCVLPENTSTQQEHCPSDT